ncbi:hypothetical protein AB0M20_38875, partial [Actinoplanes sp. NPDC051633]|uniref:hypothetical protein n=1 Tax=Actinoplanes sp. NPDC051633 TaxID=3155670 RepID=UPI00342B8917
MLLGFAIAAYFALALLDHGARADAGSIDHIGGKDPVAAVKTVAKDARKAAKPKSIAPKAHSQRIHRPAAKKSEVREQPNHAPTRTHA